MKPKTLRRLRFWSPIATGVLVAAVAIWTFGRPLLADRLYKKEYAQLAYQCDNAMHDEAAIRSYPESHPKKTELLVSADVQLLVCHQYDKLRKRMLLMGVSENQLALYGLEAMEFEAVTVDRMVDPHRMPRF
jgi:hypothetical protein